MKLKILILSVAIAIFACFPSFANELPDGEYEAVIESDDDSLNGKTSKVIVEDGNMIVKIEKNEEKQKLEPVEPIALDMKDGEYSVSVDIEGGSGKAYISSPTLLYVKDGKAYAQLVWSSSNYDYMIVGTEKYLNLSDEGENSTFEIPIACFDEDMNVIADTTAMGTPHEVEYKLCFYEDSIGSKGQIPQEASKRVVIFAMIIIVAGGILNSFVKKRRRR